MEIVETIDPFCQTVYRVYDGNRRMAEAYQKRDAEVIKAALEKAKEEREQQDKGYWFEELA